jgi:3-hydroxyacyl-CoA dehydrogenase
VNVRLALGAEIGLHTSITHGIRYNTKEEARDEANVIAFMERLRTTYVEPAVEADTPHTRWIFHNLHFGDGGSKSREFRKEVEATTERYANRIRQVAVIGTGTLGAAVVAELAFSRVQVIAWDQSTEVLANLKRSIAEEMTKLRFGLFARDVPEILDRITIASEAGQAVANADLIIEMGPTDFETKQAIFKMVDKYCKRDAILAVTHRLVEKEAGGNKPAQTRRDAELKEMARERERERKRNAPKSIMTSRNVGKYKLGMRYKNSTVIGITPDEPGATEGPGRVEMQVCLTSGPGSWRCALCKVDKEAKCMECIECSTKKTALDHCSGFANHAENMIGLRFLSPVLLINHVEITRSKYTANRTWARVVAWLQEIAKLPFLMGGYTRDLGVEEANKIQARGANQKIQAQVQHIADRQAFESRKAREQAEREAAEQAETEVAERKTAEKKKKQEEEMDALVRRLQVVDSVDSALLVSGLQVLYSV